ncbi:MAG TPA: O-antigen ligase family protein, partial [Candidatus Dormibacteraeota bacterium]|nr:O-antigen ligase family protein [Candidatus Dormibacteraeota bacterium]
YFLAKGKQAFWAGAFLLLMVGTLVLTVTRSAILALPIMICLAAILSGRWLRLLPLIGVLVVAAVIGIELSNLRLELLPRLWDFSEGSTQTHIALLQESSSIISGFPWGHGLGTGGTIGTRNLGTLAIDNENWLLLLATDMGVVPALLFLVINVAVTLVCLRAFLGVRDLWLRVMTLTVGVGAIGYLFVGNFLHSWENLVVSMGFWLLAGVAVRARDLQSKPGFVGTAALAVSNPR